jgi:uncharacterized membrane protein
MVIMGIPPLALTGAVFGAFLSGVFYKLSKGKLLCAVLGEIIGTGIIGAIVSYPVMTLIWGKDGLSLFFYVPSFICGTLIGGSIAYFFLRKYADGGMLAKTQDMLGSPVYSDKSSVLTNAISIATFGAILFVVFLLVPQIFKSESEVWSYLSYGSIILFVVLAVVYYLVKKLHKAPVSDSEKQ